ncbi:MAG: MBL fold metallo-hydrolase, partial [Alphaproteobacteria bacterium]|nr:MBL fold metallo-hydrolase [Alphaproteobacteria bacterium]
MKLSFHGASHTVTGSCFLLETDQSRILVDCGMFQGSKTEKELNYRPFPFEAKHVSALVLTHAHIDHSGLIPKLVRDGFKANIYSTLATADLCSVMLPDSGHIQEMEVDQLNRRNARRGLPQVKPIYTAQDAVDCLAQFKPQTYQSWFDVAQGFRARFWNAGHLLGSASIEIEVQEQGKEQDSRTRLLFSGDIGTKAKLLQIDLTGPSDIDHLICESTYGDVERQPLSAEVRRARLSTEVKLAAQRNGALVIPSFAVERTQELLADLIGLMDKGEIPSSPVFIDSPLAIRASEVFAAHLKELENGEALQRAFNHPQVRFTSSVEESKAIARLSGFHIILSASGMCEAGRIRHHLRNWLWRAEATILLVGFQAQGTLGRILQEGAKQVRIMGEQIRVAAQIRTLDVYSGHADAPSLVEWVKQRVPIRGDIFLVHGEDAALQGLTQRLKSLLPRNEIIAPKLDQAFSLTAGQAVSVSGPAPRLQPEGLGHSDWHNDLSRLVLD